MPNVNPLSDHERKARGSYRQDEGEAARAKAGLAKIHVFPVMREIPPATIKLGPTGQSEYDTFARILFDAGRLTLITQRAVQLFAKAADTIANLDAEGKPVPASLFAQMRGAFADIRLADVDRNLSAPNAKPNRFAGSGFAARRRSP